MARRVSLVGAMLAGLLAAAAQAQGPSAPGFVVARYAERSALAVYAGYAAGPALAVVGMVQNPRTGYREDIAGAALRLTASDDAGAVAALTAASTSDGWFTQLYLVPSVSAGRFTASATMEYYLPWSRSGSRELDLAPATAILAVTPRVGLGASYVLSAPAGSAPSHAAGPAVRVAIPRGSIRLDLLRGITRAPSEVRVTVECSWR